MGVIGLELRARSQFAHGDAGARVQELLSFGFGGGGGGGCAFCFQFLWGLLHGMTPNTSTHTVRGMVTQSIVTQSTRRVYAVCERENLLMIMMVPVLLL